MDTQLWNTLKKYKIISIEKLLSKVKNKSSYFIVLLIFLISIPTSIPAPPFGPEHLPFAIIHFILLFQLLFNRNKLPWIPNFIKKKKINMKNKHIQSIIKYLEKISSFGKNRWSFMFSHVGITIFGIACFCMAFLMFLPIPLTNFLPSFILTLLTLTYLIQDGLLLFCMIIISILIFLGYYKVIKWFFGWIYKIIIKRIRK